MTDAPDYAAGFGPFDGRIWLNCSHQGPIPRVAADAARDAIAVKQAPFRLVEPGIFQEVPRRLRTSLARLINVAADDVILGNSTTYGLSLFVRGLEWHRGDEVLVVDGDFPAVLFPWLALRDQGVTIRKLTPRGAMVTAEDLAAELRPNTRVFCTTWVHSFRGSMVDVPSLAAACRANGTLFALNASQGMGTRPFDAAASGVDLVTSCGFKYLCGPYGTGFCWIRPDVRHALRPPQSYWLANLTADDLAGSFREELKPDVGARAFDVFGTANFFNFQAWNASVEYLLAAGLERIHTWDQSLVSRLIEGISSDRRWTISSPTAGPSRTTIVVFSAETPEQTSAAFQALREKGIFVAMRRGNIRVSPHLYNVAADIDAALGVLART
ncbi:MAG TPA: aminotransferase class V-fold PLP-dependent enzyme [Vicinamibacterales bacterium]|nr:aminotransferase class V-fold PLP-dependent enzyme [Vicinamibacterales bacterium]